MKTLICFLLLFSCLNTQAGHRRARHLNPGSAGAVLALDSRFITGLSDGDPVSTWNDRSGNGNDATGSGTARPTFETNEQGGQPVLRFNGTTNYLAANVLNTTTTGSVLLITKTQVHNQNFGGVFSIKNNSEPNDFETEKTFASSIGSSSTKYRVDRSNVNLFEKDQIVGVTTLKSIAFTGSSCELFLDGAAEAPVSSSGSFAWDQALIGARWVSSAASFFGQIDCAYVTAFISLNNSLRRRLEHAAAFAFKIPCS